jgi:predicted DNA-binding protein with PD1-like motif
VKVKPLTVHDKDRSFAVVLEPGEEATACLLKFAREQKIQAAQISAIGAFSRVVLGFFEFDRRDYRRIVLDEQVELVSLLGNLATDGNEMKLHAHAVVANREGRAFGGHLLEGIVKPTLEAVAIDTPAHLRRRFDPATGLALLVP